MIRTISLLFILVSASVTAQINFESGYFIDNTGSKITCLIKNMAWKNNPVEFEYKADENSQPQIASIRNVKEFSVDNAYTFKRFEVNLDRSSNNIDRMNNVKTPVWNKETIFLKILIEGDITLYQYEDGDANKYFYSTGSQTTAEQLFFKRYVSEGTISENNYYRQQLYNLMKDRIANEHTYEKLEYKKDNLVKLFTEYNGEKTVNHSDKHNKSKVYLKITPGISLASLTLENAQSKKANFDFGTEMSFMIGAEIEYIMPFNNNKWSLFINPNVQFYSSEAAQNGFTLEAEYNYLQLPVGVRHYMFLNDKSKLFINASYNLSIDLGSSQIKYSANSNAPTNLDITKSSGFALGAGYSMGRYSTELRYGFKYGLLNEYVSWTSGFSTVGILLGYRIL